MATDDEREGSEKSRYIEVTVNVMRRPINKRRQGGIYVMSGGAI
jgi:hypothetical protein